MQITPVRSSSIDAVGYEPETKTLQVAFSSGKTYEYTGVTPEHHRQLTAASSVGAYFSKHIRPHFKGREVK